MLPIWNFNWEGIALSAIFMKFKLVFVVITTNLEESEESMKNVGEIPYKLNLKIKEKPILGDLKVIGTMDKKWFG